MTQLTHAVTAPDSPYLTASFWMRIPAEEHARMLAGTVQCVPFNLFFDGGAQLRIYKSTSPLHPEGFWVMHFECYDVTSFWSAEGFADTLLMPLDAIQADTWHHYFVAARTDGDQFASRCYFYLDCVDKTQQYLPPDAGETPPLGVWETWSTGPFLNSTSSSWVNVAQLPNLLSNWRLHNFDGYLGTMEPFKIQYAGTTLTIPAGNFSAMSSIGAEMAFFQLWTDQFIDPTSGNLDKFAVEDEDGVLHPAGPNDAKDAFGTPTYWFVRDNISGLKFEDNQGTGGDVEVVGTDPADFFPGPGEEEEE